jgi:hypothetical protein
VADVFVGQAKAPLVIRPYLPRLTLSELNASLVAGFATTAGGVGERLSKREPGGQAGPEVTGRPRPPPG